MQQDEFRTLTGFDKMSFDVSDENAPMMVSRHRVSQTYLILGWIWACRIEKEATPAKHVQRCRRDAKFGETVFFLCARGGLARENFLQSFCQTFQTKESIRKLHRRRQPPFDRSRNHLTAKRGTAPCPPGPWVVALASMPDRRLLPSAF